MRSSRQRTVLFLYLQTGYEYWVINHKQLITKVLDDLVDFSKINFCSERLLSPTSLEQPFLFFTTDCMTWPE